MDSRTVPAIGVDHADEVEATALRARDDREAFAALYVRHRETVFRYLRARCAADDDALALTAVTFERALVAIHRYAPRGGGVVAWLLRIARNAVIDQERRRRPADLASLSPEPPATDPSPEGAVILAEERTRLRRHLERLSAERAALDERVRRALDSRPVPGRRVRPRRARSLALGLALLVLLPTVTVVGAAILSTEAPYGMGSADAYDAELAAAKAVTPIPPGTTWPPYLDRASDRDGSYATGLGRSMVEYNAYCLWLGSWHRAHGAGDAQAQTAAIAALTQARQWQSFTVPLMPEQSRDHVAAIVDAAERGDAAVVMAELELNCQGAWP